MLTLYKILFFVSVITFVVLLILLIIFRFRKNKFYHAYNEDEILRVNREGGAKNSVCSPSGKTKDYITRYIVRRSVYDTMAVFNYTKGYSKIEYFIKCYNRFKRVIKVIYVKELNTKTVSKIIRLKKGTKSINVIIKSVDNEIINTSEIMPLSKLQMHLYSIFSSIMFFMFFYAARHVALYYILGNQFRPFLESMWNYITILVILFFTLLYYLLCILKLKKRSWKKKAWGVVAYEFY